MMNFLKQHHFAVFFLVVAVESLAANFAHPITPTLIQNLHLPDYSFGLLYAGMAFTNFLFSPLWANQVHYVGSKKIMGISCAGYGVGQFLFSISKTLPIIMMARLVSGFFVGGILVSFLTYIIQQADLEHRGKYLAYQATITTVFSAFGYLVGGVIGVYSIQATFLLQFFTLVFIGVVCIVCLKEDVIKERHAKVTLKDMNPFQAFLDARSFFKGAMVFLFIVVFLTSTATTAFDQNFNYFIKDQFDFPSSYNGALKAVVGFISLFANTTICLWILRRNHIEKSLCYVFASAAAILFVMTSIENVGFFIILSLSYFAFNAIYIPLLQDVCAQQGTKDNAHQIMGFYNAMKSLGMIAGALFAGFIYGRGPRLSFFYAGVFFFVSMVIFYLFMRTKKQKQA